jgi:acyl-CoA-binding protein
MAATPKKGTATTAKAAAKPVATKAAGAGKSAPSGAASKDGAGDLKSRFEAAAAAAKQTKQRPDNATMLKLYSYYKQATEGDVQGARPGGFDFVGGAKYDAWAKLKGTSRDDAMTTYIKQVERLNRE